MGMEQDILLSLLDDAKKAAQAAYVPYSGYMVGAALLGASGKVYLGCNVENASYPLCICAERTAVYKAVSEGERDYLAIAVWVESEIPFPPCGACRQVLHEFNPSLSVIYGNKTGHVITDIATLLPGAFKL